MCVLITKLLIRELLGEKKVKIKMKNYNIIKVKLKYKMKTNRVFGGVV